MSLHQWLPEAFVPRVPLSPLTLELRCPKSVDGITIDPQPNWDLDSLLSELKLVEKRLVATLDCRLPPKAQPRQFSAAHDSDVRGFVMRAPDYEMDDIESDDDESHTQALVHGTRFVLDRDDDDLLNKLDFEGAALAAVAHEHHIRSMEEISNQMLAFEKAMMNENERVESAFAQVERHSQARREMDRKIDVQYQRRVAEALDNHLTAVQEVHQNKFQIEERRIKDDAAREEAKRKEKALQEEKLRQEKLKAELEAREAERKKAEEAKAAALEAERRAKEAAEKEAANLAPPKVSNGQPKFSGSEGPKKVLSLGSVLMGAESGLKAAERRLQIHKEVTSKIETMGLSSNEDYRNYEKQIARRVKTITGSKKNVRSKAEELINLITGSLWPKFIGMLLFAEKVVSCSVGLTGSSKKTVFAYAHVIVLVTQKFPLAMDLLIAELNQVCIYTVPKYMHYSESAFETREAHLKAIGYQEEESKSDYVERLSSYMRLYAAIIQAEGGVYPNHLGIKEGWAWLVRLLNTLPANLYTASALYAFLEVAGFAMYRRYKTQFQKLLKHNIPEKFLNDERSYEDPKLHVVITSIKSYLEESRYLREPDGWRLEDSLHSNAFVPDAYQR